LNGENGLQALKALFGPAFAYWALGWIGIFIALMAGRTFVVESLLAAMLCLPLVPRTGRPPVDQLERRKWSALVKLPVLAFLVCWTLLTSITLPWSALIIPALALLCEFVTKRYGQQSISAILYVAIAHFAGEWSWLAFIPLCLGAYLSLLPMIERKK
jgi:hypothetical protein